ncbi:MAG: transcriptional regulator [Myxococcales bacterium]|nr:transcriptional regulator [Myxococcales bacterium]
MTKLLARYQQPDDEEGPEPLGALCLLPGGRLAANGTRHVFVWSRASAELLEIHETTAICRDGYPDFQLAYDPGLGRLAEGHEIRSFALWDLAAWERLLVFEGHTESVRAVAFIGEDQVLSISGDSSIRRWDAWSGECLQVVATHPLYALADDPTGGRVAVAGGQGHVYVFDRETLALRAEHVLELAVAEHAPLGEDERRRIGIVWNRPSTTIRALAWHPDGEHLLCGSADFVPKMIHAKTGRCVRRWLGHAHWVDAIAVDAEGGRLVTGSSDHTVRVWDLHTERCLEVFELPRPEIEDVLVSEGEILAVCGGAVFSLPLPSPA